MSTNQNRLAAFCSVVGILALCYALLLIFDSMDFGDPSSHRTPNQGGSQQHVLPSSDDRFPVLSAHEQSENILAQVDVALESDDQTASGQCSSRCIAVLSMLDRDLALDDQTFHTLRAFINELAAYLQNNESKRQHYLQLALATSDGDKRRFLSDVFNQLPHQQKVAIGARFIGSEKWRVRADGVTLIADQGISNLDVANSFIEMFSREENAYVKASILSHLQQSATLQGETEILHQLDSIIYNGIDASVRVAALKAKTHLSEQPYQVLPDAVFALRSGEPEFQMAGLIAIEQVLTLEQEYVDKGIYIDRNSIRSDLQAIRDSAIYDSDLEHFAHLIKEANNIYWRYFEYY